MSDIVIAYENEHYLIGKPTVPELISASLEEKNEDAIIVKAVPLWRLNKCVLLKYLRKQLSTKKIVINKQTTSIKMFYFCSPK